MRFSFMQASETYRQFRYQMIWIAVLVLILVGGITTFNVISALPVTIPVVSAGLP